MGIRGSGGEIVEVEGGHIVRSIGRKDRHSKVYTAKGPRDRRVRLSAPTAIQFYDVQDRLGYDRPSKAVDWLIKKAKTAIDELEELPAWKPNALNSIPLQQPTKRLVRNGENPDGAQPNIANSCSSLRSTMAGGGGFTLQNLQFLPMGETLNNNTSSLLPPSLNSDSIADTIKSFFPMGATTTSPEIPSSSIQFQSYPPAGDLRLSLQCFKNPLLLHHHQSQQQNHQNEHVFFSGASSLPVLDGITPAHWGVHGNNTHPPLEIGRFQKTVSWNASGAETGTGSDQHGAGNGNFIFNLPSNPAPPPPLPLLQPLFGETQLFSQRGPLQSSYTPMFRAWIDPSSTPATNHQIPSPVHQSSFSGYGLDSCGFPGFRIPVRIHGVEEHDGISDKPSSASSDSRH